MPLRTAIAPTSHDERLTLVGHHNELARRSCCAQAPPV